MRLKYHEFGKEWLSLEAPGQDNDAQREARDRKERLHKFLTDLLLAENLIVLAGLGTSLCVVDGASKKLAPQMSDLWKAAKEKAGEQFDGLVPQVRYDIEKNGEDIEALLSQCQIAYRLEPKESIKTFIDETEAIIVERCRFVKSGHSLPVHGAFLRKVARRPTRLSRSQVFTTNYDLCFEIAATQNRFFVVDGFSPSQPPEFDGSYFDYDMVLRNSGREAPKYIPNVFHLYKLHGSVNWERRVQEIVKAEEPQKPLLIYPRDSKFESSYEQPFFEIMSRFQSALRHPNTGLLVVGSGLKDSHIYQPVLSAIRFNVGLRALFVDPAAEEKEFLPEIKTLIDHGDSRLALLATGFEELAQEIPDLVAQTEEEQHRDRLRRAREEA